MTTFRRTILGASVALVLATGLTAGLTGCASGASGLGALVPTAGAAAESTTATASPAAAAVATGEIVDAAQVDVLLKAGQNQRAYPMADGTFVVVTKTEPLPANVQADMDAKTAATLAPFYDFLADEVGAEAALDSAQGFIAKTTGKRVIIAWKTIGYADSYAEVKTSFWIISGAASLGDLFPDEASARSTVDAFVAGRDDGNEYAVVYVR